jgi:cell wall assembly regulator SMI1
MLDEVTWHAWLDFLETQGIASRALLQDPAIDNDFSAIEAVIGLRLPEALKALYRFSNGQLRSWRDGISFWHDGARFQGRLPTALFGAGYEFLALADALQEWRFWKEVAEQSGPEGMAGHAEFVTTTAKNVVKCEYWIDGWLPFAKDAGGNALAIDLDPDVNGTQGQVIVMGPDEDVRYVLAPGVAELIEDFLSAGRDGRFWFDKRCRMFGIAGLSGLDPPR